MQYNTKQEVIAMILQTQAYQNNENELLRYVANKVDYPLTHRVLQNFPPNRAFKYEFSGLSKWLKEVSTTPRQLHLYVSIPFCTYKGIDKNYPEKCGFCLFPTLPFSRKNLNAYLDGLINYEIPMYAEYIGKHTLNHPVDSIFMGGGTPNILNNELYTRLLSVIKNSFLIKDNVEISTEGTPELYSYDKLVQFKKLGGTRISIGVQQYNEDLLKLSGRTISKPHVVKIISNAIELGLSVSVDLIYGWPDQSLGRFLTELEELLLTGISRITIYPLNISHSNYFSKELLSRIPPKNETKEMFYKSRELLISEGFTPVTLNDYERKDAGLAVSLRHEIAMRNGHLSYRVGLGFAAGSKLLFVDKGYGMAYRNCFNRENGLNRYLSKLRNGIFPIETYFKYSSEDLLLNYISGAVQSFSIDINDFSTHFPAVDFKEKFSCVLGVLASLNWIYLKEDIVELTLEGQFYTDIIQGLFFYDRIQCLKQFTSVEPD